jgi:hypothetical protein
MTVPAMAPPKAMIRSMPLGAPAMRARAKAPIATSAETAQVIHLSIERSIDGEAFTGVEAAANVHLQLSGVASLRI